MSDASVNADIEQQGREQYALLRPRIKSMRRQALAVEIVPGTLMHREDHRTSYSPISYQVRWQLQLASEHLVALDRLVEGHGLPDYAGYVLIRAAIETAASAYWLTQPEVSDRRVLRALQMAWWNQDAAAEFATAAGFDQTDNDREIKAQLNELRGKIKSLRQAKLDKPHLSHSDMLTAVERTISVNHPMPLLAWRQCSALAHGNSAVAVMSLQHRMIRAEEPNVHKSTSSWAIVSALTRTALDMFDSALASFEKRSDTP